MASIYKRISKDDKSFSWRAVVRPKGHPSVSKSFERKQEAEDWGQETERRVKQSQFNYNQHKNQYTYGQLISRCTRTGP